MLSQNIQKKIFTQRKIKIHPFPSSAYKQVVQIHFDECGVVLIFLFKVGFIRTVIWNNGNVENMEHYVGKTEKS